MTKFWRHKKRGTNYAVVGVAELQHSWSKYDIKDGDSLVVYLSNDGHLYARLEDEFLDGRFEEVRIKGKAGYSSGKVTLSVPTKGFFSE